MNKLVPREDGQFVCSPVLPNALRVLAFMEHIRDLEEDIIFSVGFISDIFLIFCVILSILKQIRYSLINTEQIY